MNDVAPLPALPIAALEREMLKLPQADVPVQHHFVAGCYIREVHIPADTYAVGHRHKVPHLNLMLEGAVCMVGPDGRKIELKAPQMYVGLPGRKVGYVRERLRWLNIFPTECTDVEQLEGMFFEKSNAFRQAARLMLPQRDPRRLVGYDREDYELWLQELGEDQRSMESKFIGVDDLIAFPRGSYKVKIGPSRIQGKGLIATADIKAGETICAARIGDYRTPAGRYTNHSRDPNARMLAGGNQVLLVATRDIKGSAGGFDGEEVTVNYRLAIEEARKLQ